jgi:hypothetical protein
MHIPMDNRWLFLRGGFMRPVPNYFLMWDKLMYGKNALGFFSTAIALHILTVFTVYCLVKEFLNQYFPDSLQGSIALFTAILFLFYPFHAESVMWIIARVSIIAALFTYLSFLFYIKSSQKKFYFIVCLLCFVIALFTYESMWNAIMVFAILGFLNIKRNKQAWKRELLRFGILLGSFCLYLLVRLLVLKSLAGDGYLEINQNLSKYKLLAVNLVKLFARNYTPAFENSKVAVVVFLVLTLFYAIIAFFVFRKNKKYGIAVILLWFFVLTGVVTAAPLGIDTHFNESDRYLYYSSFFFCLVISLSGFVLLSRKLFAPVMLLVTVVFISMLSALQSMYAFASSVTKTTVQQVASHGSFSRGYFIDVPAKYKAALIFRISLGDAVKWIAPDVKYDSIIIVSQQELYESTTQWRTGDISWKQLAEAKGWDTSKAVINNAVIGKNDAVYWFTKKGLYKVIFP